MAMNDWLRMKSHDVFDEAERAAEKYGDYTSTHEGLGVLAEEYHELIEAVRSNIPSDIAKEAMQVSAVALRLAEICDRSPMNSEREFRNRSGFDD